LLAVRSEMSFENPLELRIDKDRLLAIAFDPDPDNLLVKQDIITVEANQGAESYAGAQE